MNRRWEGVKRVRKRAARFSIFGKAAELPPKTGGGNLNTWAASLATLFIAFSQLKLNHP
jgi:hypothetical protein